MVETPVKGVLHHDPSVSNHVQRNDTSTDLVRHSSQHTVMMTRPRRHCHITRRNGGGNQQWAGVSHRKLLGAKAYPRANSATHYLGVADHSGADLSSHQYQAASRAVTAPPAATRRANRDFRAIHFVPKPAFKRTGSGRQAWNDPGGVAIGGMKVQPHSRNLRPTAGSSTNHLRELPCGHTQLGLPAHSDTSLSGRIPWNSRRAP